MQWLKKDLLLSFEEISRLVRIFAGLGVTKIRLTGGEPLMRKDLATLVRMIKKTGAIADIAMTTNGYFLREQVRGLVEAGLSRINVSLDSLDPATFSTMVRREYFDRTWEGIEEALRVGLSPIKINAVLIRGINDHEIPAFAELARSRPVIVRFIEFMPIGSDDGWSIDKVVPTREVLARLNAIAPLVPVEGSLQKAASDSYRFADGKLRTCLFSLTETDLRGMLRSGAPDAAIADAAVDAVAHKEEGHLINRPGFVRPERTMSSIGG